MGIKTSSARLLGYLKREGESNLSNVCMLGRQELCLTKHQIKAFCKDYKDVLKSDFEMEKFCEGFLSSLGAEEIHSLDASDFEGADMVWDLNKPIPMEYKNKFTCIIDGGTTEHVFSFDKAMENVIDMLDIGGYYIGLIPSNNWNGHGLYQLSPMLYMQLFCEKNGMELKHLYLCNAFRSKTIREIKKRDITNRTELNGFTPAELYIVAKKIKDRDGTLVLQQGDYEEKWNGNASESDFIKRLKEILPWEIQCVLKHYGLMWQSRKILKKVKL
ncbi:MAG: hypothetical protein ACI3XA_00955 [Clostridia bacterium]